MAGVNKAILLGNLGQDPEVKELENGTMIARFSLATSESYTNKSGEKVNNTEWHRIELWDGLARVASQYLKKGNTVYIEGKIKTETWTDKEGVKRESKSIRATAMQLVGGKGEATEQPATTETTQASSSGDDSDNLPF